MRSSAPLRKERFTRRPCRLFGGTFCCSMCRRKCCAPKHDASFHFDRLPVPHISLELPLTQGLGDGFCLIGKCAEKVNVAYFAFFIDDDSHGNRVEPVFGKYRVNPLYYVFLPCIILDAYRDTASARSSGGTGFRRQLHLVHVKDQTFQ